MEETKGLTRDELIDRTLNPFVAKMDGLGITEEFLLKSLKAELKAKTPERVKLKGAVKKEDLPRGRRIVATSGTVYFDKEGNQIGGDGDVVIEWDEINWSIRQAARIDAQKLRGLYPKPGISVDLSATGILADVLKEIDGSTRGLPSMDEAQGDEP